MKAFLLCSFLLLLLNNGFAQWNSNTSVNLEVAGIVAGPISTVSTSDGKTFVAFYSQASSSTFDMRVQLLDRNGNKLFGPNGIIANNYSTGSATYVFNTCLGPDNSFIIACQDQRNTSNGAVIIRVNQNGTLPWGVGGLYLGPGLAPYPALLSNGEIVVAWNDSNNKISYQKVSTSGVLAWATSKQVQLTVGTTVYGSTAAVPVSSVGEGGFTMIMQRRGTGVSGTLYAQRYLNNGDSVWTNYLQLSNATVSTTRTYSVATEGDVIYYGYYSSTGSRFNSYVQRINPDGTLPWGINGAPFSTYTGTQPYNQTTNIAHTSGSPYVWSVCSYSNSAQSQYGVYVQKFDAVTGARLFNVDGKEIYPISASLEQQTGTLALVNDAPLFMTYDANYKMYATRLDDAGNFVWPGNRIELSSTTASLGNPKGRFNFSPAISNQAVAVWNENRGTENRAYAQNISAAGTVGPLPIHLLRFTAVKKGTQTDISWATAAEENSKGFYVQRSADGRNFTNLQFIESRATNGSSTGMLEYTVADATPLKGNNYYRLQQMDKDGKTSVSQVVLVKFDASGLYFQNIYPNPVKEALYTTLYSTTATKANLTITGANGQTIQRQVLALQSGSTSIKLPVISLPKGNYWLLLYTTSGTISERWVKE